MNSIGLPINVFDCIFLGTLTAGLLRGRKVGMSEELLSLLKWLSVVVIGAIAYQPLGQLFAAYNRVFSLLSCYIMAYITATLLILGTFALIKRSFGGKLLGSDVFGRAEYYLGMGSGLVRFCCILIACLAILNARSYSTAEVRAMENFQNREFGSNYFPTYYSVQATVFENSLCGPWIRDYLGFLLIKRTQPENKQYRQKEFQLP
jgi:uncharacterized membrane protein required for colicin V production